MRSSKKINNIGEEWDGDSAPKIIISNKKGGIKRVK